MQDRKIYNCLFSQRGKIVLISSFLFFFFFFPVKKKVNHKKKTLFFFFVIFPVKKKIKDKKKALFLFSKQKKSLVHEKIYMKMRVFNFKEVFQTYFDFNAPFHIFLNLIFQLFILLCGSIWMLQRSTCIWVRVPATVKVEGHIEMKNVGMGGGSAYPKG